jgi:cytochrome c
MLVFKQHGNCIAIQAGLLALSALLASTAASAAEKYGLGTPATAEQIAGWDINVFADGRNLPAGSGTVMAGRDIYNAQCLSCHGAKGEGGLGDKLAGGMGTLASPKPVKTVGSYWPYAPTLFDYIRRAMPLTAPQTLSNDEVYATTAYVLFLNQLVKEDARLDAKTLTELKMPNRDGFIPDPRPDVK